AGDLIAELDARSSWEFLQGAAPQWDWTSGKPVLFEEAPGKTRLLELESRSERAWAKLLRSANRFSPAVTQNLNREIFQRGGWGLQALTLDPGGEHNSVKTRTVELDPSGFGLGFGASLAREIGAWQEQCTLAAIDKFVSTIP